MYRVIREKLTWRNDGLTEDMVWDRFMFAINEAAKQGYRLKPPISYLIEPYGGGTRDAIQLVAVMEMLPQVEGQ